MADKPRFDPEPIIEAMRATQEQAIPAPPEEPPVDSPVVLARLLAETIRELREEAHLHEWDIIDVYHHPVQKPLHPSFGTPVPSTFVLVRCTSCRLPESLELEGRWTIDQITEGL